MSDIQTGPVMNYMKGEHGRDFLRADQMAFAERIDRELQAARACVEALRRLLVDVVALQHLMTTDQLEVMNERLNNVSDLLMAYDAATRQEGQDA